MIDKSKTSWVRKIIFLLIVVPFYWGANVRCSGGLDLGGAITPPTMIDGANPNNDSETDSSGTGKKDEKDSNTNNGPAPLVISPPSPSAGNTGGSSGGGGGGDLTSAANGSNSQPTQTAEGTDPDPNDNKFKPNPCPPGVDCNRVKRDSREILKRPEFLINSDIYTDLINGIQNPSSLSQAVDNWAL